MCEPVFGNLPNHIAGLKNDLFIYCPLIFIYSYTFSLLSVCKVYRQNIQLCFNFGAKIYAFTQGSQKKRNHSYTNQENFGQQYTFFFRKRGLIVCPASLKMGLFGPHIRTVSYIGSYPPPRVLMFNNMGHVLCRRLLM